MEITFKGKLSKLSLMITLFINALLLCMLFGVVLKISLNPAIYNYLGALGIIVLLILPYLMRPALYTIAPKGIVINKIIFPISIPANTIIEIKEVSYSELYAHA